MPLLSRTAAIATFAAILATGAALGAETGGEGDASMLTGTSWKLVALGDEATPQDIESTLVFGEEGDSIGGRGGCNSFGGSIEYEDDGAIAISDIFSTLMACDEASMTQERGFFDALTAARTYAVEDGTLTLVDAEGNAVATLDAAPGDEASHPDLTGTTWRATALGGEATAEEVETTLIFGEGGQVNGNTGCNGYGGPISFTGDGGIAFEQIVATQRGCPDPAGSQERALFAALDAVTSYSADAETLTLLDGEGEIVATFAAVSQ